MKLLLLAGAGTSIELGVPGMAAMAEEFAKHTREWNVEPALVQKIMGATLDVEHLIEELDRICTARPALEAVGESTTSLDRADRVRAEVEWYVQHAAERVMAKDAALMWGSVLRATGLADTTFVTTNYDRAIELAANAEGVSLDDGFGPYGQDETSSWAGFGSDAGRPKLIKLHGSTDWYSEANSAIPVKLRHPMPLFGRAALQLTSGRTFGSALVLPSREKLLTRSPYPRLSQAFYNAADECNVTIIVGSSLRDRHIRDAVQETAKRVPTFVVNPVGDAYGLDRIRTIGQPASAFLISHLPNALLTADPIAALEAARAQQSIGNGILGAVSHAIDVDEPSSLRCRALEELDSMEVSLDPFLIRQLLEDADPQVARHCLGSIPLSPARQQLIVDAEATPHMSDAAFREDLELLRTMVA